jgi:hypothetical protein
MTAPDTNITSSAPGIKHEGAKQWLQRQFRKVPSSWPVDQGDMRAGVPEQRPQTASSRGINAVPAMPLLPIDIRLPLNNASNQPPPRPHRPDSGTMRNVDAWLDTSIMTPSPPLMSGLPYWRKALVTNAKDTIGMQHALPIVREVGIGRPATAHRGRTKSFRRRARRVEVQMPVSALKRPSGSGSRKQINRRSNSMPAFTMPYDMIQQGKLPIPLQSPDVRFVPTRGASRVNAAFSGSELSPGHLESYNSWRNSRSSGMEGSTEQHRQAFFGLSASSVHSTRPSTTADHISREDSVGTISDVPSYFSGLPPLSYHSRPESVLTTSSFGCIDGMNPAQRQISQQRAAAQRGVRGRLKRLAQSFTSSN